jgi:GntR family transcriptional regulator of vanillate catabolism
MARNKTTVIEETGRIPNLDSESLSDRVMEAVRAFVVDRAVSDGGRVNEVSLSGKLGVSRTPIRAALQSLVGEGLVEYRRNKGYFVRQYDVSEVFDAFEIRALAEGLAARLAAERGLSPEDQREIEGSIRMTEAAWKMSNAEEARSEYSKANQIFHAVILRAAHSPIVSDVIAVCDRIPQTFTRNVLATQSAPEQLVVHHYDIFEAILSRRPKAAEQAMYEHVISIRRAFLKEMIAQSRE